MALRPRGQGVPVVCEGATVARRRDGLQWLLFSRSRGPRYIVTEVFMPDVAYVSNIHIERIKGPLRVARLPGEAQPVYFSVHSEIAKHYGLDMSRFGESHAATIDYVVAGLGG